MSTYVLGTDSPDDVRRFATEVAPAVRELVDVERGRRAASDTPVGGEQATVSSPGPVAGAPLSGESRGDSHPESRRPGVTPTPDDGTRLLAEQPWDEATRPTHDGPDGASYPPAQQGVAQHLVDIHDGLRAELEQVRGVLDQVRTGHLTVGAARSVVNTMTMRQNNWTLGAYCESYCRIVTGHHTLEDRSVFPHLRRSEPGLGPVLDRLEAEHDVIHDVLEQFDRALVHLVAADGTGTSGEQALDDVQHAIDLLTDTLLSHLAYEERELIGPLARHGFS
jgi:hemerythrin-like domain-containing protein